MTFIPSTLRRDAGFNFSDLPHFRPRRSPAGLYGLRPGERHRYLHGLSHLDALGLRARAEFWLEAIGRGLELDEVLEQLDRYRAGLTVDMVRAAGADRLPPRMLDEVPR